MLQRIAIATGAAFALVATCYVAERPQAPPGINEPTPAAVGEQPRLNTHSARLAGHAAVPAGPQAPAQAGPQDPVPGCTIDTRYLANPDGTVTPLYTCERAEKAPPHPYTTYSDEALESLAWGDADAARILGMRLRLRDEAAATSLVVRAAALAGGDPAPILEYANAYPLPGEIDGVPVRRTVHARFVLGAVADMLEKGSSDVAHWELVIRQVSSDPDREIEMLRDRARAIVEEIDRIREDVTGVTGNGRRNDA